jgi:hypothetical protein
LLGYSNVNSRPLISNGPVNTHLLRPNRLAAVTQARNNRRAVRGGVFCAVRPKAIYREPKRKLQKYEILKVGGGQAYDRSSDQDAVIA